MTTTPDTRATTDTRDIIDERPTYISITRHKRPATDKKGQLVMCETGDGEKAQWTGVRRPTARIMARTFAFCDQCWKRERLA